MNNKRDQVPNELLMYQTSRLQELIQEILQCCEDRKLYESQKFGVLYAELKCLMLFRGERYLTVKNIAQKLDVAKSRVTKIISGLIEKGMVERVDDPKDSRVKLISLTLAGQNKSDEIDVFHKEIHGKILMQMNEDERKKMFSCLELLRSSMEAVKGELV